MDSLKSWNKQTENKTYANFKVHLCKEYNELRQVGALSIKNSKLQPQLNFTATSENMTEQISASVTNDLRNTIMDAIMALQQGDTSSNPEPIAPQANSVTVANDNVLQLAQLVKDLKQEVQQLKSTGNNNSTSVETTSKDVNPKTGKPWRRYCHTHGCCNHWGRHCKNKGPNHKDDATFRNRMGGSNFNCLPVNE